MINLNFLMGVISLLTEFLGAKFGTKFGRFVAFLPAAGIVYYFNSRLFFSIL